MIWIILAIAGLLIIGGASGWITYRLRKIRKQKAFLQFLRKRGYDTIGYA